MAHPSRELWARGLAKTLGGQVVWDERQNVWDTGRRSLLTAAEAGDYALVVQDDAILAPDFLEAVEQTILRWSSHPISYYAGTRARGAVNRARRRWKVYMREPGPRWGVAVLTPSDVVDDLISYCDEMDQPNYDLRMMDFWQSRKVDCVYTVPSLANHRPVAENPSLANDERTASRQAAWFAPGSALAYRW